MSRAVIDTDVISFLFKNHPIGSRYDPELAGRIPLISFMTVAELERWAIQRKWNEQRLHWLHLYLRRFTVVPSSPDLAASGPRSWWQIRRLAGASNAPMLGLRRQLCCKPRRWSRTIAPIISEFRA